jgi:hypothetical protein
LCRRCGAEIGGGNTSIGVNDVKFLKSDTNGAPCAFRKFVVMNIYPVNDPVWPAAVNSSLRSTVQVAPAARVPSADRPIPGRVVALVVRLKAVPAPPVAARGKKSSRTVPDDAVAPPPPAPNGSAVVFAREIPVSNPRSLTANGTRSVVVAETIFATVTGPTSA